MRVRVVKTRMNSVEIDRRGLLEIFGHFGQLLVMDVSDQGMRRPMKVARLLQEGRIKFELEYQHTNFHFVVIEANDRREYDASYTVTDRVGMHTNLAEGVCNSQSVWLRIS